MNQLSLFDMNPGGNAGQNGTPGTASMTGGPLADRALPLWKNTWDNGISWAPAKFCASFWNGIRSLP